MPDVKSDPRPNMLAVPIPKPKLPKHLEGEPTVTMLFPHAISLNCDDYQGLVHFEAGLQEVPESLVDHWYVVQQGAKPYVKPSQPVESPEALAEKLRAAGYAVEKPATEEEETVEEAAATEEEETVEEEADPTAEAGPKAPQGRRKKRS